MHAGFPHSDIRGSMLMCSSPRLFAAYRVFHRLPVPGHPPCALLCLTSCTYGSLFLSKKSAAQSKMVLTCSYRRICKACPSCSLVLLAICFLDLFVSLIEFLLSTTRLDVRCLSSIQFSRYGRRVTGTRFLTFCTSSALRNPFLDAHHMQSMFL